MCSIDWKQIGLRLKEARKEKNLTQSELSEICNCSDKYVSEIERGVATPSIEFLLTLLDVLDKPFDFLVQDQLLASAKYLQITFLYDMLRQLEPEFLDVAVEQIAALLAVQNRIGKPRKTGSHEGKVLGGNARTVGSSDSADQLPHRNRRSI